MAYRISHLLCLSFHIYFQANYVRTKFLFFFSVVVFLRSLIKWMFGIEKVFRRGKIAKMWTTHEHTRHTQNAAKNECAVAARSLVSHQNEIMNACEATRTPQTFIYLFCFWLSWLITGTPSSSPHIDDNDASLISSISLSFWCWCMRCWKWWSKWEN